MYAEYNITNNRLFLWPKTPADSKGVKLPDDLYQRTRDARMQHWSRGCFTCLWSPYAEDLLIELAGKIMENDEPDDLERRADRYSKYATNAERDEEGAVDRILSGRAHTDRQLRQAESTSTSAAEKAQYWHQRIAGSISRAEYREQPGVIFRRIQGLEKDLRAWMQIIDAKPSAVRDGKDLCLIGYGRARHYATVESIEATKPRAQRWVDHLNMRLEYEREYLRGVGGDPDQKKIRQKPIRRATPDDGIKKGMMVTWMGGSSWHKDRPVYTSKVVSCGTVNIKVERPFDDPLYMRYYGYTKENMPTYFKEPVEVMRKDAKLAEVSHGS